MKNMLKRTFSIGRVIGAIIGILLTAVYFDKINSPVWLIGSFVTTFVLLFLSDCIELAFFSLKNKKKTNF